MINGIIKNRLELLRNEMKTAGIDAYLVPSDDDHASEYVNDHFKGREWISGFTGSAGTVVVTEDEAFLWTDGRYFLQAAEQLEGSGIELMKDGEPGVPAIPEKIRKLAADHDSFTLGFTGDTMTYAEGKKLAEECGENVRLKIDADLIDKIWEDRPVLSPTGIWKLPESSCGRTFEEKLEDVREKMAEKSAGVLLISDLMETAWLFNLRGADIQNTPVFYGYTIVTKDACILFTLPGSVTDDLREELRDRGISLRDYNEVRTVIKELTSAGTTLWADGEKTSISMIPSEDFINSPTPVEMMKAVKNDVETAATRNAHLKDGIAVTKFIYWLKKNVGKMHMTEISCADYLEKLRRSQDGCFDLSFPTIAGYNSNGAIIHYEPTPESDTEVEPHGFLLVDSGGQYIDGTTDITRTISVGPLTQKMKEDYTYVLKGHIDLGSAVFSEGTTGFELDEIARKPIKDAGLDYAHGTGHGVGHVLSVHEGPNYISKRGSKVAIIPGMITSNEPGLYMEGEFGIRIESEILCMRCNDAS